MRDEPGDQGPPSQSPLNIDQVGNLIVVERRIDPQIPDGKGRRCPQCRRIAWVDSRFCWNCKFDFDRAAIPRCHPKKLLFVSVSINLLVLLIVIAVAHNGMRSRDPTSPSSGSSPTPVLALPGTIDPPQKGVEHDRKENGGPVGNLGAASER